MTRTDIQNEIAFYKLRLIQDPEGANLYNAMLDSLNEKLIRKQEGIEKVKITKQNNKK